MKHDELVAAYGAEYGLPDCALDASGRLTLELSEDILVYFQSYPEDNALVLTVPAAPLPSPSNEQLTILLGNNFFYRGARSNVTGYNIASQEVVVVRSLDTGEMTPADLDDAMGTLIDDVRYWRDLLDSGAAAWEGLDAGAAPSLGQFNPLNMA